MDNYQRQQFDFFLQTAVERFVERIELRCRGAERALDQLQSDPNSELVWLNGFVEAVMNEFLLDNIDGASFILRSLGRKQVSPEHLSLLTSGTHTVESLLVALAKQLLRDLLIQKTIEALQQHASYQPVQWGEA